MLRLAFFAGVRVGAAAATVLTGCLQVDRTAAKVKRHRRELLARPCFAWNISATIF